MDFEIWHDDLYATRTHPVKKRQCNRKPCVKFISDNPLIVDKFSHSVSGDYPSKMQKAIECERVLNELKNDRRFCFFCEQVASIYDEAINECVSEKLKAFCETRKRLVKNMSTMWSKNQ